MTSGSSMHAMILIAPLQAGQVATLELQSVVRYRRVTTQRFECPKSRLLAGSTRKPPQGCKAS